MEENNEPKTKFIAPPPLFHCKIRKIALRIDKSII